MSFGALSGPAQSGNAGTISGTVADPSGAVVANAGVEILNPVSQYSRTAITDGSGKFNFPNVPSNSYHFTVTAPGFAPYVKDVDVRSSVSVNLSIGLKVTSSSQTVTVEIQRWRPGRERSHLPR